MKPDDDVAEAYENPMRLPADAARVVTILMAFLLQVASLTPLVGQEVLSDDGFASIVWPWP